MRKIKYPIFGPKMPILEKIRLVANFKQKKKKKKKKKHETVFDKK